MRNEEYSGWEDVRAEALRRIQSRAWAPGALIPSEEEFARELSCARTTVNRALRSLAEEGLLIRKRRAGTRVAELPQRAAKLNISLVAEEIRARGASPSHLCILQDSRPLPSHIAAAMSLPVAAPLIYVETLHLADARPFAFETRFINPQSVPAAREADFASVSANEWLLRHAPFNHGTLDYSARPAEAEAAEALGCAPQTPTLVLDRVTHGPEAAITWVRMAYAPDYHLTMKL
ncbi:GntR family transcriptional regulator [Lentibacter sp. XHP0401]|uniref:GntR family transcriptional regulator n=1 Tax=Lentibacter sp. XHP0401 TaxID=2984334 RepID=UPI0021E97E63|nr:GntR family transcriptional regulator [Lentibacter sp. XHP0401]MCV2894454.1 GntR family transcriptional regulator [Lentibacter sp. XHP0401]